jgi:hypothetical protein
MGSLLGPPVMMTLISPNVLEVPPACNALQAGGASSTFGLYNLRRRKMCDAFSGATG